MDTFATANVRKIWKWSTCFDFALGWLHSHGGHGAFLQQNPRGRMQHCFHCSSQTCSNEQRVVNISVTCHVLSRYLLCSICEVTLYPLCPCPSESMPSFIRCRLPHHLPELAPVKSASTNVSYLAWWYVRLVNFWKTCYNWSRFAYITRSLLRISDILTTHVPYVPRPLCKWEVGPKKRAPRWKREVRFRASTSGFNYLRIPHCFIHVAWQFNTVDTA